MNVKMAAGIILFIIGLLMFSAGVELWYATPLPAPIPHSALSDRQAGVK